MILLAEILRRYWLQAGVVITLAGLLVWIGVQKHELTDRADKLATAAKLHQQDQQRIADLGKKLADQNSAVSALVAQQAVKQAQVTSAVAKAQAQQRKVVTLLVPTDNKKPSTCEQAMPDVRSIIKGLQQ
jgi:hypothetical protein